MSIKTKKCVIRTGFRFAEPARVQHNKQSSTGGCTGWGGVLTIIKTHDNTFIPETTKTKLQEELRFVSQSSITN